MIRQMLLASVTFALCTAIIVNDPPEQLVDFYYAGPEFGFLPVPRYSFHNRPVYSVARAILPSRPQLDAYDLHGLYRP